MTEEENHQVSSNEFELVVTMKKKIMIHSYIVLTTVEQISILLTIFYKNWKSRTLSGGGTNKMDINGQTFHTDISFNVLQTKVTYKLQFTKLDVFIRFIILKER